MSTESGVYSGSISTPDIVEWSSSIWALFSVVAMVRLCPLAVLDQVPHLCGDQRGGGDADLDADQLARAAVQGAEDRELRDEQAGDHEREPRPAEGEEVVEVDRRERVQRHGQA